ncbi:hypothetical protein BCV70DRAFT_202883 [Testicularia cyperi]|uniref:VOC domain-containing protein n=1 Tax=Testicularia cyperi TaxID=1882483 RepID=A0A317XHT4_9BASI|nr:hypothetical protein BCV70DRAFT_202883 [Testicularia cyperi]
MTDQAAEHYRNLSPGERHVFRHDTDEKADANLSSVLLNHVCFRITSPEASLGFFDRVLGYKALFAWNIGPQTVFFLHRFQVGETPEDVFANMQSRQGLIELIWNRDGPLNTVYEKAAPQTRFFHIGITVDDVQDILDKAMAFGSPIHKSLGVPVSMTELGCAEGTAHFVQGCEKIFSKVAFISDPDGNWIELVPKKLVSTGCRSTGEGGSGCMGCTRQLLQRPEMS